MLQKESKSLIKLFKVKIVMGCHSPRSLEQYTRKPCSLKACCLQRAKSLSHELQKYWLHSICRQRLKICHVFTVSFICLYLLDMITITLQIPTMLTTETHYTDLFSRSNWPCHVQTNIITWWCIFHKTSLSLNDITILLRSHHHNQDNECINYNAKFICASF